MREPAHEPIPCASTERTTRMDLLVDVLADGVKDTLQLVPFLFLTYLAMEALEHGTADRMHRVIAGADRMGPLFGALLGAVPQCGFSAMAATLFAGRVVTAGTLVAVILSTSDEMVPVFFAHQEPPARLVGIIALKVIVGLVVGLALDMVLRVTGRHGDGEAHIKELCERSHCHCDEVDDADDAHAHVDHDHDADDPTLAALERVVHNHEHGHIHPHGRWCHIVRSALVHTCEVTFFIFLISLAFGFLIEWLGGDAIATFLGIHPVRATLLTALVGMIPNCGASVAITELYLAGTLATGPTIAGLLSSGGVGLLVLFRTNKDIMQNVRISALVYVVGVAAGLIVGALGIIL